MSKELTIAVLLPTYDELGTTIDRSLFNIALRMQEVEDVAWGLFVGVNGTDKQEEVVRVRHLLDSHSNVYGGIHTSVHHYSAKGKENAMNQLASEAKLHFGSQNVDLHIGTDVKVYRNPDSFLHLISEFIALRGENKNFRYLGASVVPYPIDTYEQFFSLSDEQRLFYTLLEIDKDSEVLSIVPKSHLRGGLYITQDWQELYTDIPDDYAITRRARKEHGDSAIRISENAVGYVIPRQSFADYFAVRAKRSVPAEELLKKLHPELTAEKESGEIKDLKEKQIEILRQRYPKKALLYDTKRQLDIFCRSLVLDLSGVSKKIDDAEQLLFKNHIALPSEMNIEYLYTVAEKDPDLAAKLIVVYYRSIVEALAVDINSIHYGPREERYRGMLPIDYQ